MSLTINGSGGGTPVGTPTLETGTYTGDGTYGSANPCSITFNGTPVFVCIMSGPNTPMTIGYFMAHSPYGIVDTGTYTYSLTTSVSGKTISWYSARNKNEQLNNNGMIYYYFALTI